MFSCRSWGLWELVFLEVLLGWELWRVWGAGLLGAAEVRFLRFTVDRSSQGTSIKCEQESLW